MVYIGIITNSMPLFVVIIPLLVLVALFEMIGLKTRHNIAVLSVLALLCLVATTLIGGQNPNIAGLLYAIGVVLASILAFYALATARRGRQQAWFASLLIMIVATLGGGFALRAALAPRDAAGAATLIFVLTLVLAASTLAYGLFAPDIPKPRGGF